MIFLDITDAARWRHASGLARVSARLAAALGEAATRWSWRDPAIRPGSDDWILTPELFSEFERPGFSAFLDRRPCRMAALYHDAIPLKYPDITWPSSVRRHPGYMKLLARFDRVWSVSEASRQEVLEFWRWQGISSPPPVSVLHLGADGLASGRVGTERESKSPLRVVSVGILEPRKNQGVLLDAFAALRAEGLVFELHLVGRVNPHFGAPIIRRVREVSAQFSGLVHHANMPDDALRDLLRTARVTAFPSLAEGCGLPVLESLWQGVPCVCSDIAPVLENAAGGGCLVVAGNGLSAWVEALRRVLTDDAYYSELRGAACRRELPTWSAAAGELAGQLAGARGLQS